MTLEIVMKHDFQPGSSHPLGATLHGGDANFSLFSRAASRAELASLMYTGLFTKLVAAVPR